MDRVRAHHNIFIVTKRCKMAEFGRRHILGFKPEYGYGYYEFTVDEFFKPHKKVILVRQVGVQMNNALPYFYAVITL